MSTPVGAAILSRLVAILLLCILPLAAAPARAQGVEVVRGRVLGPGERPVEGATVTITGMATRAVRTTTTDARGSFTALFASAEGEYEVQARAIGYAARSVVVAREGDSNVLVADLALVAAPAQLDAVTVTGARRQPARGSGNDGLSVGSSYQDLGRGMLFSLDPADLRQLAASVPGVTALVGANGDTTGLSVLGSPADQNSVVVDGSTFDGAALPPDALGSARLVTTTFDPSRGRFSGGQLSATTRGGTDTFRGVLRATRADRRLSWADPASPIAVPTDDQLSGSIGGPMRKQVAHYFAAFDVRLSARDRVSLLEAPDALLGQRGLSRDTVEAVKAALQRLGVPLTTGGIPGDVTSDRQTAFVRLDLAPTATTSLTLRADGAWTQQGGTGIQQLGFPTLGNGQSTSRFGFQASGSAYLRGFLGELRSSLQQTTSRGRPYVMLPGGAVRVGVSHDDGREGLTSLRFGGASSATSESRSLSWETTNELSWLSVDSRHQVKLGQSFTLERNSSEQPGDRFGSFDYQTLDDLAANRPSSYTRTFSARERTTSGASAALWVGDEWRARHNLQLQLGARLDASRPGTAPGYNPVVDSLFELRTDRLQGEVGFSPRLGFRWSPWQLPLERGRRGRAMGAVRVPAGAPAPRGALDGWWRAVSVSGGVGGFRGTVPAARIAALMDATGLENTTRRLSCVGDATPLADWSDFAAAAPDECLDGTAAEEFATRQPTVTVLSPDFRAPVSWRGNVGVQGLRVRGWSVGVQATHSIGRQGESRVDLNLHRAPRFTLEGEDGRPVYAAPELIVPGTGAIAPGAGRIHDRFGSVTELLSDLRSEATQLQLTVAPPRALLGGRLPLNFSYTLQRQRAEQRGFGGSTGGDPSLREWAAGQQPTHQLQAGTSTRLWWFGLALRLNVTSGTPYTPMVAGDVNGDGSSNDRAFVFDPAAAADPELATQMRALLAAAPRRARECLEAQLGRIAGRSSCSTGWQSRVDMNLRFDPPQSFGFGDRLRASLNLVNASGALFRLTRLDDTPLGRAASPMRPDPLLLHVTGFDSTARRFTYRVNQQFGDEPASRRRGQRATQPFQLQLGLEYDFGGPPRDMMARNLGLVAGRGEPALTAAQLRERLRRLSQDPVAPLLAMRDTLALTEAQLERLGALGRRSAAKADSILEPLVSFLVERGGRVRDAELSGRMAGAMRPMQEMMLATLREAVGELTEEQRAALPPSYSSLPGLGRTPRR